jgi:curli biogenesis system outer membrane secretion channel CsgG
MTTKTRKTTTRKFSLLSLAALMLVMGVTPAHGWFGDKDKDKNRKNDRDEIQVEAEEHLAMLSAPLPTIPGPKRTVAVSHFDAVGSFMAVHGGWDVGGGLSAMLTTALTESDRFIVLERGSLSTVMSEQQLAASGLTNKESGAQAGNLFGAQILIMGSVTEFGQNNSGGGFSIGFAGSDLGGAISPQFSKGYVAMDVRFVDSTTGQVIRSITVRKKIKSSALAGSIKFEGISIGGNKFNSTPLGEACREAINEIAQTVALEAAALPWTGRVVDAELGEVYLNAGHDTNIQLGDRFKVYRVTKTLTDPTTGELLGQRKRQIGTVEITTVEEKLAIGTYHKLLDVEPGRNDLVTQ